MANVLVTAADALGVTQDWPLNNALTARVGGVDLSWGGSAQFVAHSTDEPTPGSTHYADIDDAGTVSALEWAHALDVSGASSWSCAMMVRHTQDAALGRIINAYTSSGSQFSVYFETTNNKITCRTNGSTTTSEADVYADGEWAMIGITHEGDAGTPANSITKVYVDGVLVLTHTGASNVSEATTQFGARSATSVHPVTGGVDRIMFFDDVALAQADHLTLAAVCGAHYQVISRDTTDGADTFLGAVPAGTVAFTLAGLSADSTRYYWIKPVSACGVGNGQAVARRLRRVAMDGAANLIAPAPNAPFGLQLTPGAGGQITATWRYRAEGAEAAADKFEVFLATGPDPFDFDTPTHTVSRVGVSNTQDLGTFADGTTVRCVVRALTQGDVAETNTTEATVAADATAPAAPVTLSAEVISG